GNITQSAGSAFCVSVPSRTNPYQFLTLGSPGFVQSRPSDQPLNQPETEPSQYPQAPSQSVPPLLGPRALEARPGTANALFGGAPLQYCTYRGPSPFIQTCPAVAAMTSRTLNAPLPGP